jgi:hypothetical protein
MHPPANADHRNRSSEAGKPAGAGRLASPQRRAALTAAFTAAPIPQVVKRRALYAVRHHRLPRLRQPRSFTEKLTWRILNDRRPILASTCDKLRVKEDGARAGIDVARTLWSGVDLQDALGVPLPDRWVLKPNHRSGMVYFGRDAMTRLDLANLRRFTEGWMYDYHGKKLGEWAYSQARQLMFIEEMIGNAAAPPVDFRFFTFDGIVNCIQVDDSYVSHARRFYTPAWTPLDVLHRCPLAVPIAPPRGLDTMLGWAREFGRPFDFMRVDFYDVEGTVFLGELTPYPSSGLQRFSPREFDLSLGEAWTLPSLN